MRVIGSLSNESQANQFSEFLFSNGIENRIEVKTDPATQQISYQVWVADEDSLGKAGEYFEQFKNRPNEPSAPIHIQVHEEEKPKEPPFFAFCTICFLAICSLVYLINLVQELSLSPSPRPEQHIVFTPIQKKMLFDLPLMAEQLDIFFREHLILPNQTLESLPPDAREQLKIILKTPVWEGFYEWTLLKFTKGDAANAEGPMFTQIRQGQIWRLFSPCILHRDLLHILFNMLWLWMLARPIEQRIGWLRLLVLILPIGIVSNVMQYLMSGYLFLGFSGIVTGLAGFIWMREKIAPWEGYPLQRSTILFLVFFVLAMFVLQMLSFFVQLFTNLSFILNIANTAHIAGAVIGALLGRLSWFAWRVR